MAVVAVKVLYIPATTTTTPVNNNTHLRTAPKILTHSSCRMPAVHHWCRWTQSLKYLCGVLMALTGLKVWDGTAMLHRIIFLLCALHYAAYQIKTWRSQMHGHWQHMSCSYRF